MQATKPGIVKLLSKLSGFGDDLIQRSLQRTPGVVEGARKGEVVLKDVIERSAQNIVRLANDTLKKGKQVVDDLNKFSGGGIGSPGTRREILKEGGNFVSRITNFLRKQYNIGVEKGKILIFDRPNLPSNIVSGGDRGAIQEAYNSILKIKENTSIKQIDSVFERLYVLRSKTPVGSPTGAETRKIIGNMIDDVVKFVESVGKGEIGYRRYAQHLKDQMPKRIMLGEARELFEGASNLGAKEISKVEAKLLQLWNTGKIALREFTEELGEEIGEDIAGTAAGTLIKEGGQVSQRAPALTQGARGIIEKTVELIPRGILRNYLKTGNITPELINHPALLRLARSLKITAKGALLEIINIMEEKKTR